MSEEIQNNSVTQERADTTETSAQAVAASHPAPENSRTQNMLVAIMAVLVIMAAVQVFQTQQLMAAVSSGSIKAGATQQTQGSGLGIQSQVGGCG